MNRTHRLLVAAMLSGVAMVQAGSANAGCRECWASAALVGGTAFSSHAYLTGYLPGVYAPYYGYAAGFYGYPQNSVYGTPEPFRPVRYRSVRYVNKTQFVAPAVFDPAARSARR